MTRAVIDTNISISGLLFGGLPLQVVEAALDRRFVWVTSPYLIEELEKALAHKKFGLTSHEIKSLTTPVFDIVEVVVPSTHIFQIKRCPGDNRVLECALDGDCDHIVTGDHRDLLSLKSFHGISILTARQFLEII